MRWRYERVETEEKPVTECGGLVHARRKRTTTTVADPDGVRTTTTVETKDRHCPSADGLAWVAFLGVCLAIFFFANACLAMPLVLILAVPAYRIVSGLGETGPDAKMDGATAFVVAIGLLGAWWVSHLQPSGVTAPITWADVAFGKKPKLERSP